MWHAILDIVRALEGRALLWQDAALVWCAVPTVVSVGEPQPWPEPRVERRGRSRST
jgi:hypothetical protein